MPFIYRLKSCEVHQLESKDAQVGEFTLNLFKFYEKRINKTSSKVKLTFILVGFTIACFELDSFIAITGIYLYTAKQIFLCKNRYNMDHSNNTVDLHFENCLATRLVILISLEFFV